MAKSPDAVKGSIALLKRQVKLAREQRDAALHDVASERQNHASLADACKIADWTCPRCGDKADVPGSCRECLIDESLPVDRVPGGDLVVLELHAALTVGLDMLDEFVRQTMEANPEWRTGYRAMRDGRMKHLALAKQLWERAFGGPRTDNAPASPPPRKP